MWLWHFCHCICHCISLWRRPKPCKFACTKNETSPGNMSQELQNKFVSMMLIMHSLPCEHRVSFFPQKNCRKNTCTGIMWWMCKHSFKNFEMNIFLVHSMCDDQNWFHINISYRFWILCPVCFVSKSSTSFEQAFEKNKNTTSGRVAFI